MPLDGLLGWCFYHLLRAERAVRLDAWEQQGSSDCRVQPRSPTSDDLIPINPPAWISL